MRARQAPYLVLLLLAACGSSPKTHFYTLTPVPSSQPVRVLRGSALEVNRVVLPAVLDRLALVESGGGERLVISDQNRWASPLDDMVQHVLAADLKDRLRGNVLAPGDPAPRGGARGLVVNIRQFMSDTSGHVTLQADWSVVSGHPPTSGHTHSESIDVQAASAQADAITAAMSRALGNLADRIAAALGH